MYHIPCSLEKRVAERRGGGEGRNVYVMVLFIIPSLMKLRQESQDPGQPGLHSQTLEGGYGGVTRKDIFSHTSEI